jgi:type II secretory pathway component HofQ
VLHIGKAQDLGPADQKFTGRPIDIDFQGVELAEAFRTIAGKGGLRAEVSSKVGGQVMLKLNGVPWDQAFDIVVRVNGLRWKRQGSVLTVGPEDEMRR